ncbi:MAG: sulfatase-like hydrolase/transferase [Pirellulaceae bacterium]
MIKTRKKNSPSIVRIVVSILVTLHLVLHVEKARSQPTSPPPKKPNVIFIITDDQAVDTIAAWQTWGNDESQVKTPNLDRLARSGTSFRNCYNMGSWSGAVCICSRSMLMSGQTVWKTQDLEKEKYKAQIAAHELLPQRIRAAGYRTWMSGKWHLSAPVREVFDEVRNLREGMPKTVASAYQRPLEELESADESSPADEWKPWDIANGGYWQGGKHWSEVAADDAEEFLKKADESSQPFFLYLAFNAPHDPRQSPQEYVERYPLDSVVIPKNFLPVNPHHQAMGLGSMDTKALRDEALAPFPRTEYAVRIHRQEYYALVSHLDTQIGRILQALDASGQADRTLVVFTSDHGLAVGRHGLMGKQNLYEHSLRVPMIIMGPGVPHGKSIETRVYMQDAMATVLDWAEADQSNIDFRTLKPLLEHDQSQGEQSSERTIYAAYQSHQRAVIAENHKLILYPDSHTKLLFDLTADPLEIHNLAEGTATINLQQRLFQQLREQQILHVDTLDLRPMFGDLLR